MFCSVLPVSSGDMVVNHKNKWKNYTQLLVGTCSHKEDFNSIEERNTHIQLQLLNLGVGVKKGDGNLLNQGWHHRGKGAGGSPPPP